MLSMLNMVTNYTERIPPSPTIEILRHNNKMQKKHFTVHPVFQDFTDALSSF
jgi:hypothetical protein